MLTDQHIAEDLSRAYVQAIAAKAGVNFSTRVHDYGVDGTFHPIRIVNSRRVEAGFPLDFQLKASKNWTMNEEHIGYDLEVKTYNDLILRRNTSGATPCILILLCLPGDPQEWLEISEEQLLLRRCCYWHYLVGDLTENTETIRVRIPDAQRLTSESLLSLLQQVKEGSLQ